MTVTKRKDSYTFKRENTLDNQERIYPCYACYPCSHLVSVPECPCRR